MQSGKKNNSDDRPIGIFDSGVGGLTVVQAVSKLMPSEKIVYLGDTARYPYGPRSKETVISYSLQNMDFLLKHDVKAVVVACNTATAFAFEVIKEKFPGLPVADVISPCAEESLRIAGKRKIAVIGTEGTVNSGAYEAAIKSISPEHEIFAKACPLFVPLAEENEVDTKITSLVIEKYLREIKEGGYRCLILGCTHYPLLRPLIEKYLEPDCEVLDSAGSTARIIKKILTEKEILREGGVCTAGHEFFVTDRPLKFREIGERFLGRKINKLEKTEFF
ncbi:MAG: glutamate racemase [Fibrobacterota bacterium]